jgi:hypothetical protein
MERVFLSYSFRDEDREPARWARTLLESHGVRASTGEVLGGGALSDEVKRRIDAADGFVGIWTRRDSLGGDPEVFRTSNWLVQEATYARAKAKPTIVLVEDGVDISGMDAANERIALSREAPHEAILRLAQTLAEWRAEYGRVVAVRLTPDDVARKAAGPNAQYVCRYRLHEGHQVGEWRTASVYNRAGGVFTHLAGVGEGQLYEIWLKIGNEDWQAPASAQDFVASLERVAQ